MKKVIYSFIFLFCAVLTLQAETMVVATYNLRYLWYPRGQISAIAGLEASHARI